MTIATDQQVWNTLNIYLQKRLSSRHISLLTQVVLNKLLQIKMGLTNTNKKAVEKKGWAIPKWKKFRYSEKQKSIAMQYFEEGEQSGIKRAPEQILSVKINSHKANKTCQSKSKQLQLQWTPGI